MAGDRGPHDVGGEQRPRRGVGAELVRHQREVDQAGPADRAAAGLLADEQGRPAQLGALPPVRRVEAGGVVPQPADLAHRDGLVQEPRRRLPEELLVGVQVQPHGPPPPLLVVTGAVTTVPSPQGGF
jgi:hypothetical protein